MILAVAIDRVQREGWASLNLGSLGLVPRKRARDAAIIPESEGAG